MEITKREVILSISIIAIGLILGIIISGKLSDRAKDKNSIYNKATHIESKELFEYAIRTDIGNAFVYGDLISLGVASGSVGSCNLFEQTSMLIEEL